LALQTLLRVLQVRRMHRVQVLSRRIPITVCKLTERQIRWSLIFSRYNFVIVHILGKENKRADTLSKRDQDLPVNTDDQRLINQNIQLLKPEMLAKYPVV
jgi:hypothetical protein